MIRTILLDLDNTLLGNDMGTFLPAYFAALQKRMGHLVPGRNLPELMIASVQRIQAIRKPTHTHFVAFMNEFSRQIGHPPEVIQGSLDKFYEEDYPNLREYTQYRPEASKIVEHLLAQGYCLVIATNPLFPAVAIEQRLAWAGLSGLPIAHVTTMENSYFSKPNLNYYQDILTTIHCTPELTWMVGDDPINDIVPARTLGFKTWWISNQTNLNTGVECDQQGNLATFWQWLQAGGLS